MELYKSIFTSFYIFEFLLLSHYDLPFQLVCFSTVFHSPCFRVPDTPWETPKTVSAMFPRQPWAEGYGSFCQRTCSSPNYILPLGGCCLFYWIFIFNTCLLCKFVPVTHLLASNFFLCKPLKVFSTFKKLPKTLFLFPN